MELHPALLTAVGGVDVPSWLDAAVASNLFRQLPSSSDLLDDFLAPDLDLSDSFSVPFPMPPLVHPFSSHIRDYQQPSPSFDHSLANDRKSSSPPLSPQLPPSPTHCLAEIKLDEILACHLPGDGCFAASLAQSVDSSPSFHLPNEQISTFMAVDLSADPRVQFGCDHDAPSRDDARVDCGDIERILDDAGKFEGGPESCSSQCARQHQQDAGAPRHCSSDFENVLDILLEDAEQASPNMSLFVDSSSTQVSTNASSSVDWKDEFSLIDEASNELSVSTPALCDGDPALTSSPSRSLLKKRQSWSWEATACDQTPCTLLRSCSDIHRYLAGDKELSSEPPECTAEQCSAPPTQAPISGSDLSNSKKPCVRTWAGPTLLDIESALARRTPSTFATSSPIRSMPTSSALSPLSDGLEEWKRHSSNLEDDVRMSEFLSLVTQKPRDSGHTKLLSDEELISLDAWRRPLRHRSAEPKYTLKIRKEEDANDGYRWRKYGQKTIKNSPYPRSYYRCTTRKCLVKKQVERSIQEPDVLLVTYEGIHLHHRPNPLTSICTPSQLDDSEETQSQPTSSLSSPSNHSHYHFPKTLPQVNQDLSIPCSSPSTSHGT